MDAFAAPVSVQRAELLNAKGYAYQIRPGTSRFSALLAVSAPFSNGCQSLRLVVADNPATPALEVEALIETRGTVCTQIAGDAVETITLAYPLAGRTIRVIGRNKVITVTLPPLVLPNAG